MKGMILAGGLGTRLRPLTTSISKQLLPVYDKPLIHYPLGTLMSAGIREVLIVVNPDDEDSFIKLLGHGEEVGIEISYQVQDHPRGLAHGLSLGKYFVKDDSVALILGDNVFHGVGLGRQLRELTEPNGAIIFAYPVSNPSDYGVVTFDENGLVKAIEEKPLNPSTNYAVPGLYFYENSVFEIAERVRPSARGEMEITDVNNYYLKHSRLRVELLPRGTAWLDTGSFQGLHDASSYMRIIEERQGLKVCCIEEISWRNGWITSDQLAKRADTYGQSDFGHYLRSFIEN